MHGEHVVFVIANLDRLALELSLDEAQSRTLQLGDRVELARDAGTGTFAGGRVVDIAVLSGAPEPRATVRIGVDNRRRELRPGQAVSARIFASSAHRALVIPKRALVWIAGRPAVFVADGHNSASAAAITLGAGDGEQMEVRLGLSSGQHIASEGVPRLREASFL